MRNALGMELCAAHSDEILRDLGYPLLTLVNREIRPINQFFVDLQQYESMNFTLVSHKRRVHLL
jgi:hypothetical protein